MQIGLSPTYADLARALALVLAVRARRFSGPSIFASSRFLISIPLLPPLRPARSGVPLGGIMSVSERVESSCLEARRTERRDDTLPPHLPLLPGSQSRARSR